jgi:hypothetical protein
MAHLVAFPTLVDHPSQIGRPLESWHVTPSFPQAQSWAINPSRHFRPPGCTMLHLRLSYCLMRPSLLEQDLGAPRLYLGAASACLRSIGRGEARGVEHPSSRSPARSARATARLLVWGNGYVANRNVRRDAESLDVGDTGREFVGASECIKRPDHAGHA